MEYTIINNIEGIVIFKSDLGVDLKYFTRLIADENNDDAFAIKTVNDAIVYLNTYCDNLTLHIN